MEQPLATGVESRRPDVEGARDGRAPVLDVLREHALLLMLIAGYVGTGLALGVTHLTPRSVGDFSQSLLLQLSLVLGAGVVAVTLLRARLRVRAADGSRVSGRHGWAEAWRTERSGSLGTRRLGGFLLVLVALPLFARAFIGWKAAIPSFNPFSWDAEFAAWDAALHGGTHPWEILQPILGRPFVTRLLDSVYLMWHLVLVGVVVWQAGNPDRAARQQFLLAFVLAWILLGTGLATVFSSAGPCYYTQVTGQPDPYVPLFQYLQSVDAGTPLGNLQAQQWLWNNYQSGVENVSISAMPSMHVALPLLYLLASWRKPVLACGFAVYTLVILVASVHLGWHYAIDGYVSALAVPGVWWLAGLPARASRPVHSASEGPPRPRS
jgi:hypothetical protein